MEKVAAEANAPDEVTAAAESRIKEMGGELVEPPADDANQVPYCFGAFDPSTYPCSPCAVRADCQLEMMGL